ncbi:hypothetical protein VAE151_690032 [Vibrio aestuarianus]|uniref:Uncharacterized protein n=1 Tax=Vibrio aestuarianus TaxID=28171 RepID=A0ABM9FK91_9VIBR|nr:hypothetical protein VAE063_1050030 [Vibrio aestuarianus]CAH8232446.1 hypothetical protein VIBAE_B20083 [Vibrio aestuarianus subsp. francensis]CAH8229739.1 hypothetical protein VAE308_1430003 [Vibrio aestuarianus]CAH8234306.1 hypothetical protein VAE128_530034 [Vibrio aestuarianus]CAH8234336.1 hypothetical protein VAE032_360032 [Vibrio aestuarianus]
MFTVEYVKLGGGVVHPLIGRYVLTEKCEPKGNLLIVFLK